MSVFSFYVYPYVVVGLSVMFLYLIILYIFFSFRCFSYMPQCQGKINYCFLGAEGVMLWHIMERNTTYTSESQTYIVSSYSICIYKVD